MQELAVRRDEHSRLCGARAMAAVRSFAGGRSGFAYTTDVTPTGLLRALRSARAARAANQHPPPTPPSIDPDSLNSDQWLDHSVGVEPLADALRHAGGEVAWTIRKTRTSVHHVRSDTGPLRYCEGSSVLTAGTPAQVDTRWGRALSLATVTDLIRRVDHTAAADPWSFRRQPVLFGGPAGAALTAIVLRALLESPRTVAAGIAGRLPAGLGLLDDASDSRGPAAAPFDAEGWPTSRRQLISSGELVISPDRWGRPARASSTRGLSRRIDLARPPIVAPSNVSLIGYALATAASLNETIAGITRGLLCESVNIGALSFNPDTGLFAAPCDGRLIRDGEATSRRVCGILQGTVGDLVAGVVGVWPSPAYLPLDCGLRVVDVLVADGVSMRAA